MKLMIFFSSGIFVFMLQPPSVAFVPIKDSAQITIVGFVFSFFCVFEEILDSKLNYARERKGAAVFSTYFFL